MEEYHTLNQAKLELIWYGMKVHSFDYINKINKKKNYYYITLLI
jgi:hypothetical protein